MRRNADNHSTTTRLRSLQFIDGDGCPAWSTDPEKTPKPWPTPAGEPWMVAIPNEFQPQDGTGTILEWRVYRPTGTGPWPVVLLLHGGQFRSGSPFQTIVEWVAEDLRDQGYYTLVPSFRQAPCGRITGQPAHDDSTAGRLSGRPSQQIADVKTLVRAARADSNCKNGEVAVIGASSGGTHALWVALDTTTFQDWSPSDRPNCAVTFSAPCDFSDQKPDVSGDLISIQSIQNYVNTCDRIVQKSFSPVSIVTTPTAQVPFRPLLLVHASADPMVPSRNIVDMQCALIGASINPSLYQIIKIQADPYKNDHAFALWRDPLDDGSGQVRQKVLAFLHTYVP